MINVIQLKPVIDASVRKLCLYPYLGHPKGCPNWGKHIDCPPKQAIITDVFNLNLPVWMIFNRFSFEDYIVRMKKLHPNWSNKQCACCLYWQGTARKQLRKRIDNFKMTYPDTFISIRPEAMGINVTASLANVGINLEWPPKTVTYQVAIAGSLL